MAISKATKELSCAALFYLNFCIFQDLSSGKVMEIDRVEDDLYLLKQLGVNNSALTAGISQQINLSSSDSSDISLWYKRFGHVSTSTFHKLLPNKLDSIAEIIDKCSICPSAKQTRFSFPLNSIKSTSCIDIVHMDIWGPYKIPIVDGHKYFLTIVDDYTRTTWIYLLKLKSNACFTIKYFLSYVKTQFDKTVKVCRTDRTEFVNDICQNMFKELSINHQKICAYLPQQNGMAERKHRHILEVTRALRLQANNSYQIFGQYVLVAVYIINRLPLSMTCTSPCEKLYNKKPSLNHFRVLECLCYAKIGDRYFTI